MRKTKTRITSDGTIETDYNDLDVEHTYKDSTPPNIDDTTYPPAVMKAFKRAKKASMIHDARSRKIVAALRSKREGVAKPSAKTTRQSTLNF